MCRFRLVFQTSSLDRRRPPPTRFSHTCECHREQSNARLISVARGESGNCPWNLLRDPRSSVSSLLPPHAMYQRRCRPGRPPIAAGTGGWAWARWGGLHRGGARAGGRTHVRGQQGARGPRSLPDAAAPKLHSGSTAVTDHSLLGCP